MGITCHYHQHRAAFGTAKPATAHLADVGGSGKLRSEEHTSELQSHSDIVCRLLLEKKKLLTCKTVKRYCRKASAICSIVKTSVSAITSIALSRSVRCGLVEVTLRRILGISVLATVF